MAYTCDSCRRTSTGSPVVTVTGRDLCDPCNDRLTGAAAGLAAGDGVAATVATAGWYARLRRRLTAPQTGS
ncbi:hypothetical protein [Cellulomonas sp. KRMCY2]|uniref:hypothetical protein n=1 Tax=Cellulomonas sp. KRMCY2 TaxID=1304865 RepID=UPI00045EAF32|nr:hypothetical protein [Cellulomonas sp. KRMCY2]